MRILCFLLLATNIPFNSCGQEMRQSVVVPEKEDPVKIYQLIHRGRQKALTHTDSAIHMLKIAVYKSEQLLDQHFVNEISAMPEEERQTLKEGRSRVLREALISLGAAYTDKGDYKHAAICYQRMFTYSIRNNAIIDACRALNNLGNTSMYQGDYARSAQYYFYAAELAKRTPATDTFMANHLVRIYNNMGSALLKIHQPEKALHYLENAESMAVNMQFTSRLPSIFINKATVYDNIGSSQKAWDYNNKAYMLAKQLESTHTTFVWQGQFIQTQFAALKGMGDLLLADHKPTESIPYLEAALRLRENINPYYTALVFYSLGSAYLSLKNYPRAAHFLHAALEKATASSIPDCIANTHRQLARLYEQTQEYPRSLRHLQAFMLLNDSLLNKEKTDAVSLLDIKYRTAEKEKMLTKNQLLINQQKRQLEYKNIWIAGISATAVFLTVIASLLYSRNRNKQRFQKEQIRNLQQEQEIGRLKALMEGEEKERIRIAQDLHDGIVVQFSAAKMSFRSLSNQFRELENSQDFRQAIQQLDNATRDLRQTAHNLLPDVLLEEGLAEAVYYFCKNLKQNTGLNIDFELCGVVPRLPPDFELSVYRIIQELAQNVIKHASATQALIQLNYQKHLHLLGITAEDNGTGIPDIFPANKKGIGLKNIKARVNSLGGHIDIRSAPENGTIVYIEFDLRNIFNPHTAAYVNQSHNS